MKTILLTGPARGIGLSISNKLVNEGYCVVGIGRKLTPDFEKYLREVMFLSRKNEEIIIIK